MPTFEPPFHYIDRRFDPSDVPVARAVLRYYRANPTGMSVWVLDDGTVTQDRSFEHSPRVVRHYGGGRIHKISNAEAAVLSAAGYTVTTPDSGWHTAEWGRSPWGASV